MPSQMHGKSFENHIKAANGIFSHSAADRQRSPDSRFDIDGDLDKVHGYPTSIKASGTGVVTLSDARKFWESLDHTPYRILVGLYSQKNEEKIFHEIDEFIVLQKHRSALLGSVSLDEVKNFHEGLKSYRKGNHEIARKWAQKTKQSLTPRLGAVSLNPKIDSKTQRRLQCSMHIEQLNKITGVKKHTESFGTLGLPITIISRTRTLSKE